MFGLRTRWDDEPFWPWLWDHVVWCLGRRELTFWWQRRTRGFDDSEIWSLDVSFCDWAAPRIRLLAEKAHGHPSDLNSVEEWQEILEAMATGFEKWSNSVNFMVDSDDAEVTRALKLFRKHFFSLWD